MKPVVGLFAAAVVLSSFSVSVSPTRAAPEITPPDFKNCDKLKKGSPEWKKCTSSHREDMSDQELYYAGYWLAHTGQYQDALSFLTQVRSPDERVLTYIGFATRKLGDHATAMGYYTRALTLNPNYTIARSYMGEALITIGRIDQARDELAQIGKRCGATCSEYLALAKALQDAGA